MFPSMWRKLLKRMSESSINETTYTILRVYFASKKVPIQDEIYFLNSLGKLSCLAIERAAIGNMRGALKI